jgi:hypothetical protein
MAGRRGWGAYTPLFPPVRDAPEQVIDNVKIRIGAYSPPFRAPRESSRLEQVRDIWIGGQFMPAARCMSVLAIVGCQQQRTTGTHDAKADELRERAVQNAALSRTRELPRCRADRRQYCQKCHCSVGTVKNVINRSCAIFSLGRFRAYAAADPGSGGCLMKSLVKKIDYEKVACA